MNFKFALSILSAGAIGAFANTIPWSIDNVNIASQSPVSGNPDANWQYVFLTDDNGTLVNNGRQDWTDEFDKSTGTNEGVWSDSSTSAANYIVALWDGSSSQFYAVKNGDNYVTVNSGDFNGWSASGSDVGATTLETVTNNLASGTGPYSVVAVPEPATAALALVGVAMLVRRRK